MKQEMPWEICIPLKRGESTCCVYRIILDTGHFYIGGTVDLRRRIHHHRQAFRSGKCNILILEALKTAKQVRFEILERVEFRGNVKERENYYLQQYWGNPLILNRAKDAITGGVKRTNAEKEVYRQRAIGRKYSDATKEKLRQNQLNRIKNDPSVLVPFANYVALKRIRIVAIDKNDNMVGEYESIKKAGEELGIHQSHIGEIINGYRTTAYGYTFYRLNDHGERIENKKIQKYDPRTVSHDPKIVLKFDAKGNLIEQFPSIAKAARAANSGPIAFSKHLKKNTGRPWKGFLYKLELPN
jgi:group I intron endonuclease